MPGTWNGILDGIGIFILASIIFMPAFWFVGYFLVTLFQNRNPDRDRWVLVEPASREEPTVTDESSRAA
jgi:hypothetical protein